MTTKNPVIEEDVTKPRYFSADEQARYESDMRQKATYDYYNAMIGSWRKGWVKGLAKGLAKSGAIGGTEDDIRSAIQVAVKMLKKGKDLAEIEEFTGLPTEILRELELQISQRKL